MKKLSFIFLSMFAIIGLRAQEKVLFYEEKERNPQHKLYIYPTTVQDSERTGMITVWFEKEYITPQKAVNGKYYVRDMQQIIVSCKQKTIGFVSFVSHSKNGNVVNSYNEEPYLVEMSPALPNSVGMNMVTLACMVKEKMDNPSE